MDNKQVISQLPYSFPFLFVDEITSIDQDGITGNYTFPEDSFFYKGHFKSFPVTPGVILTECSAQIGVVCLGIFLLQLEDFPQNVDNLRIALSSTEMDFYLPVMPGEKVTVKSEKEYFRFNKLKCKVSMYNKNDEVVCRGRISGMVANK